MTEPIKDSETNSESNPYWFELNDETKTDFQSELDGKIVGYEAPRHILIYPEVNGKQDPLALAHFVLINGVANEDRNGQSRGLLVRKIGVPPDGGDMSNATYIYLAAPSNSPNKEKIIEAGKNAIATANRHITELGGKMLIPQPPTK